MNLNVKDCRYRKHGSRGAQVVSSNPRHETWQHDHHEISVFHPNAVQDPAFVVADVHFDRCSIEPAAAHELLM